MFTISGFVETHVFLITSHRSPSSWYSPAALSYEAEELASPACSASQSASHSIAKGTGSGVPVFVTVLAFGASLESSDVDESGIVVNGSIAGRDSVSGIANRLWMLKANPRVSG